MPKKAMNIENHTVVNADGSRLCRAHFRDIDEQASQLLGHQQEYQQISRGAFAGTYTTVGLGDGCALFIEEFNQTLLQRGCVPPGTVSFIILLSDDCSCRYQGQDFTSEDLAFLPPGSSFSALCPPTARNCAITLRSDELAGYLEPDLKLSSTPHRLQPRVLGDAAKAIRKLIQESPRTLVANSGGRRHLRLTLVSTLAACLQKAQGTHLNSGRAIIQRACNLINSNLSGISIASLCDGLQVSRRTLEAAFYREFEMGPAGYIRALRLNYIRRGIVAAGDGNSIADVAARWGIWHPSRLSQAYANHFGELPSATKSRSGIN
jgi:AraC family transcriptional regulator, ethanolamine operon transcriptional activator